MTRKQLGPQTTGSQRTQRFPPKLPAPLSGILMSLKPASHWLKGSYKASLHLLGPLCSDGCFPLGKSQKLIYINRGRVHHILTTDLWVQSPVTGIWSMQSSSQRCHSKPRPTMQVSGSYACDFSPGQLSASKVLHLRLPESPEEVTQESLFGGLMWGFAHPPASGLIDFPCYQHSF